MEKVPLGLKCLFKLPFKIFKEMEMSSNCTQQQCKTPHSPNPVVKLRKYCLKLNFILCLRGTGTMWNILKRFGKKANNYLEKHCLKISTILAAFFINHRVENCSENVGWSFVHVQSSQELPGWDPVIGHPPSPTDHPDKNIRKCVLRLSYKNVTSQ